MRADLKPSADGEGEREQGSRRFAAQNTSNSTAQQGHLTVVDPPMNSSVVLSDASLATSIVRWWWRSSRRQQTHVHDIDAG